MDIADKNGGGHSGPESRLVGGAAILLLVFGAVVALWMFTAFDDWVPVAAPQELPAGVDPNALPKSAQFRCSAPLGERASAVAAPQAAQALEAHPLADPSIVVFQELTREPCVDPQAEHRILGMADLVVSVGLLLVLFTVHRRRVASHGPESRSPTLSAAP